MTPMYNLLDEPWLPVRLVDGSVRSLGLLDVFRRSGEIAALAETAPPSLIAEYRLLLAITHRALAQSRGTWSEGDRELWFRTGLPGEEICEYLAHWRERFWLSHAENPFMQVAALASASETRDKRKPWTQISISSAIGNNPVVFDHALDNAPTSVSCATALAHLLGYLQFAGSGTVKVLRGTDSGGALFNTAAVLPIGSTLSKTMALALHRPQLADQPYPDLPAWERPPLSIAQLKGDPVLATGPNDRYTRQSRAALLDIDRSTESVRWVRFAEGLALGKDEQQPDPMACFREGSKDLVRVTFDEGRAVWRDLPALVPAPQLGNGKSFRAALVMERAAALSALKPSHQRGDQPVLVAGVASDKGKALRWRAEYLSLPDVFMTDPDKARELRGQIALAENLYRHLQDIAVAMVRLLLPDPKSKDSGARARQMVVESGPLAMSFFAAAEQSLWLLMLGIAEGESISADRSWQCVLRDAANLAWRRQIDVAGNSARVLLAETRVAGRLQHLLRDQLSQAFPPGSQLQIAVPAESTITQGD